MPKYLLNISLRRAAEYETKGQALAAAIDAAYEQFTPPTDYEVVEVDVYQVKIRDGVEERIFTD